MALDAGMDRLGPSTVSSAWPPPPTLSIGSIDVVVIPADGNGSGSHRGAPPAPTFSELAARHHLRRF
jgi:hypothetical protein